VPNRTRRAQNTAELYDVVLKRVEDDANDKKGVVATLMSFIYASRNGLYQVRVDHHQPPATTTTGPSDDVTHLSRVLGCDNTHTHIHTHDCRTRSWSRCWTSGACSRRTGLRC
jgi:hypothetical protein